MSKKSSNLNFFSKLTRVDGSLDLVLRLSPLPAEGVSSGAVLRLALTEADPDVALELDGVAVRKLEGVERRREESLLTVVQPLLEDVRIGGASVLVGDGVDGLLVVVVDGSRDAVAREAAVDLARGHFDLK